MKALCTAAIQTPENLQMPSQMDLKINLKDPEGLGNGNGTFGHSPLCVCD